MFFLIIDQEKYKQLSLYSELVKGKPDTCLHLSFTSCNHLLIIFFKTLSLVGIQLWDISEMLNYE